MALFICDKCGLTKLEPCPNFRIPTCKKHGEMRLAKGKELNDYARTYTFNRKLARSFWRNKND